MSEVTVTCPYTEYTGLLKSREALEKLISGESSYIIYSFPHNIRVLSKDEVMREMADSLKAHERRIESAVDRIDKMLLEAVADESGTKLYYELRGLRFNTFISYMRENLPKHPKNSKQNPNIGL